MAAVKVIVCAESGAGKTGALASLAEAGYSLRMLDLDNNAGILRNYLTKPNSPYVKRKADIAKQLTSVVSLSEPRVNRGGTVVIEKATVWSRVSALLANWEDGETKLGSITTWGEKDVLVVDTFTRLSTAAMNFQLAMNGTLNKKPTLYDYGDAQHLLQSFLEIVNAPEVKCSVVLNCHIDKVEDPVTNVPTEYPMSIGNKLAPKIATYFPELLRIAKVRKPGTPPTLVHVFQTVATGTLGVKSSAPFDVQSEYPIETGLAAYFKAVRGE